MQNNLNISTNYIIVGDSEDGKAFMIESLAELAVHSATNPDEKLTFLVNGSLDKMLFEICRTGYNPSIGFNNGIVDSIRLTKNISIKDCSSWADNEPQNFQLTNQTLYEEYSKIY